MEDYVGQMMGATLFLLGVGVSWILWRKRGAASGLRGLAWAFLLLALGLVGVLGQVGQYFATLEIFDLMFWVGLGTAGLAVVLYVVSGVMKARGVGTKGRAKKAGRGEQQPEAPAGAQNTQTKQVSSGKNAAEDDFSDIEAILRERGIT
jgi:hypothetical protein